MDILDFIKITDDALDLSMVSKIIRYLNYVEKDFVEGTTVADSKNKLKNTNRQHRKADVYNFHPTNKNLTNVHIYDILYNLMKRANKDYKLTYNIPHAGDMPTDISALRYTEGFFYKPHVDHCMQHPRTLSAIFLLNNDYEGGHLCFYEPNNVDLIKRVEVKANRLIMWPSNFLYPHAIEPVTKGKRYSIVTWIL